MEKNEALKIISDVLDGKTFEDKVGIAMNKGLKLFDEAIKICEEKGIYVAPVIYKVWESLKTQTFNNDASI